MNVTDGPGALTVGGASGGATNAFGSARDKPDSGACADILVALERLEARAFVYLAGMTPPARSNCCVNRQAAAAISCLSARRIDVQSE
jgi:hypothetical protein